MNLPFHSAIFNSHLFYFRYTQETDRHEIEFVAVRQIRMTMTAVAFQH